MNDALGDMYMNIDAFEVENPLYEITVHCEGLQSRTFDTEFKIGIGSDNDYQLNTGDKRRKKLSLALLQK